MFNHYKTIAKLEFDKVVEQIEKYAFTEIGKKKISETKPFFNLEEARAVGNYISEAKNIIIEKSLPPFSYVADIRNELSKTSVEGVIVQPKSILAILELAEISRKIFQFLKMNAKESCLFANYSQNLFYDKNFEMNIRNIITDEGDIKDTASKELRSIRQTIIDKQDNLRKVISKILKRLSESYLVQDEYITQRDGRIVLPIKAEHKRHVKGFIHAESATGQTVYIEPEETLELNNEIMSLSFAEKREIERILKNLSVYIGNNRLQLQQSLLTIAELDSIFAKAQYSIEILGSLPNSDTKKDFCILNGKHPLLIKKIGLQKTIPLNITIGENRIVLITGPNAGGKTVVLKTVGLLTLMFMSGLHVPCSPDSNFLWFDKILIDIGDQQSLEDDLSTFSSHLTNIKEMLNEADENSLVLLDELGTGTDPVEGSAIAIGVLIELKKRKTYCLATTHHSNLKILASNTPGFENASMLFDTEKFIPTYVFTQGLPGASYAFEIASRVGIPQNVLNTAKENIEGEKSKLEDILFSLEQKSNELKEKLNKYEIENARLAGLINLYSKQINNLEKDKKEILRKTKTEAEVLLKEVNSRIENAIKSIRESNADKNIVRQQRSEIEKIKEIIKVKAKDEPLKSEDNKNREFKIGDFVKIKDSQTFGEIYSIEGQRVVILAGSLKLNTSFNHLEHAKRVKVFENNTLSKMPVANNLNIRLDIRGLKPDEAEFKVIKYLDEAYSSNLHTVEILHGKGNGVLKKLVRDLIKNNETVKNYHYASVEFGGEGITVVEFND